MKVSFYQAKKNLEQVEQSLFDSVKQNDTEKVSTNVNKLKEKNRKSFRSRK